MSPTLNLALSNGAAFLTAASAILSNSALAVVLATPLIVAATASAACFSAGVFVLSFLISSRLRLAAVLAAATSLALLAASATSWAAASALARSASLAKGE